MNEAIWKCALIMITLVVCGVGMADAELARQKMPTITEWLRDNPGWFIWPVAILNLFILCLMLHLYGWRR